MLCYTTEINTIYNFLKCCCREMSHFWSQLRISSCYMEILSSFVTHKHNNKIKYLLYYSMKFLFQLYVCMHEVAQSCPTHWDPMDCSLPGSSIHGIFQARALECVAISFSISCIYEFNYCKNNFTVLIYKRGYQMYFSFIYIFIIKNITYP